MKMVRKHHFHISIQEYYRRGKENLFPQIYNCPNPKCTYEGRLRFHGFYSRNVLTMNETLVIFIKRYFCPDCRKTVSLQPSFVLRSEEHTSELQSRPHLVCRLLLEKKKTPREEPRSSLPPAP